MRKVSIHNLKADEILAYPILDAKGRVLLSAGVRLTESYIRKMKQVGVDSALVEDSRLDGVFVDVVISSKTKAAAYKSVNIIRKDIESNRPVNTDNMKELIKSMIHDILSLKGALGYVSDIRGYDEFIFHHAINTAILALIIGVAAGYSEDRLLELGVGCFVHDIGKIQLPGTIINKIDKLTTEEFDIIKEHPKTGYELLRKTNEVSLVAAHISLQHHERWDGSGYPRHIKGTKIHEYARVAAIADVYEALTSNRVYKNAIEPYEAHEYITAHSGLLFDPSLITTALHKGIDRTGFM